MKLTKTQQSLVLFVILFLHFTIMDLFVLTKNSTLILIEESLRLETILVHLSAALLATVLFVVITKARELKLNNDGFVGDRVWVVCSVALLGMIGLFMM